MSRYHASYGASVALPVHLTLLVGLLQPTDELLVDVGHRGDANKIAV